MAIQKRALKTRAKLVDVAETIVSEVGYEALRVEEVVARAGVAKGTFFSHFKDKDALMDLLIGTQMLAQLEALEGLPPPQSVDEIIETLMPSINYMRSERYVFDVILRHSGAAAKDEIGPIAQAFDLSGRAMGEWAYGGPFRKDISPLLLSDGIGAFLIQALALHFCSLHNDVPLEERLREYLNAWLLPGQA